MKAERGFTLLEVMVALAVFALLAAAVLSASQYVLRQAGMLQERLFASWLADNHLAELRLQSALEPGRQQWVRHFDRREWRLSQNLIPAFDKRLIRVELEVRLGDSPQVVHRGTGWLPIADAVSRDE
ncbi:type II secretion system minor pseudopilin GspI [Pseudomonas gingeri]|uniref:Type II secretion system protein I n=1 Tax=Pseudomonas gingeri TaxID=117681 RepID=A0A7Y8CHH6_9PSED|nr:type II secretion system minor pseudopilin GspI [Pseudomonas gingeri]NWA00387.1 type II secretion system minor pseudopilin GspI [Pseudomonas gingeri]NWA14899.1 type II secretion system minor pseudopilin GspI [Pseudomonas gingeri]NWA58019.1 type II secretion system minor pseudopilin GspI [Pseudomonas gingeri]NWA96883.1 type II secretion system minor pseudopilin GspI [Pseudomonas gingeri]NWB03797.1 type II secretion system minor pseudopilin GspI [Pseudomonas gingeri]